MDVPRQKELIQLCQDLVLRPGFSGRDKEVARFVSETMRSLGYDSVTTDSYGNVLGRIIFSGKGEKLLLTSQMDHVNAGDAAEWSQYPFGAFEKNERIYGRAASDQKGALAAMIMAGAHLKEDHGFALNGELVVAAAVHQETFESVASKAISDSADATCVIVGEASALSLERGQRGRAELQIETFGKMAHSSHPEFGINAADKMNDLLTYVKKTFIPPKDPFLGEGILVLTSLFSTPLSNSGAIPEKCTAVFDRRLLLGETLEGVSREIRKIIGKASETIPDLKTKVSFPVIEDRCYTGAPIRGNHFAAAWLLPENSPYIQNLREALAESGLPAEISNRSGFGTNGCYFAAEKKLPTIIYGPSERELVHGIDEYIVIDQLLKAYQGYYAMAKRVLSTVNNTMHMKY